MSETTAQGGHGSVWTEFCASLKRAGDVLLRADMQTDPRHLPAGLRYLSGLLSSSIDLWLNAADLDQPALVAVYDNWKSWSLANPDGYYLRARLRGDASYRVWGTRGTVPYLSFELSAGIWSHSRPMRVHTSLASRHLCVAPDGTFEITLSAAPQPGNWMRIEPDVEWLHVRQFFNDWNNDTPAAVYIERTDADPAPAHLTIAGLRTRLGDVAWFVEEEARLWVDYCLHMRTVQGVNVFPQPTSPGGRVDNPMVSASGARENQYTQGYYRIEADEALIVEFKPPPAAYWNIQLGNMWYEPLDFAQRLQSYNGHQAVLGSDGVFRAVIAHDDPGVPNWLDTGGFREGVMLCRFQFAEEPAPQPRTRVVPYREVVAALPAGTPRVEPLVRRQEIARRRQGVARRFR